MTERLYVGRKNKREKEKERERERERERETHIKYTKRHEYRKHDRQVAVYKQETDI